MATLLGSLLVSLGLDSGQFSSGLSQSAKEMKATQKKIEAIGGNLVKTGAVLSAGITAPFAALVSTSFTAAQESQQAIGQVNAALASMGPVAGRTSDQLVKMAGDLQNISNFDDDDILKSVTANLLTFGNVSGDVFDRAQQAAVNLSARLGQDLQSSAIQLGKALNDPVKGVTALQRVGVSFTESQRAQIAAMVEGGNAAGAQALILSELEKQFGGAAAAQRAATPTAESAQQWRTLQENIGAIAIKVLPPLLTALTNVLSAFNQLSPSMQTVVVGVVAVGAALGPLLGGIGGLVTISGSLLPLLPPISAAFVAIGTAITTVAIPAIASFIVALSPILLPLAAVAGAIALVVAAVRHWDKIKPYVDAVVGYMNALYTGVKMWVVDRLGAVWNAVVQGVETARKAFFKLYDAVVGNSYIPDMVDGIGQHIGRLDAEMVSPILRATGKSADAFKALADATSAVGAGMVFGDAGSMPALFASGSFEDVIAGAGLATEAANDNADAQVEANIRIVESYGQMANNVIGSIGNLVGALKSGDILGVLESIIDVVTSIVGGLQGIGAIKSPPSNVGNTTISGFRAAGGPVVSGRGYIVGEKGPEYFTPSRSGTIIPNDQIGGAGGSRVQIVPSPYFDVIVDGRSAAQAGALMGENNRAAARANSRRLR